MAIERLLITIDTEDKIDISEYIAAIEKAGLDLESRAAKYEITVWSNKPVKRSDG